MMLNKTILTSLLVLIVSIFIWSKYFRARDGKVVKTNSGSVRGIISVSRDGNDYYEWLGIPYAESPINDLRFATPNPIKRWDGVKDVNGYRARCAQLMFVTGFTFGEEDCLYLNVHVPKVVFDNGKKVPVIVNIYGGAFVFGASQDYAGDYFADEPVLLVDFNYRLGALGFMTTGDDAIRGNMGLKDQQLALKWIKENVEYFGGDPSQITVVGLSAGAVSTHILTLSQKTRGLFHKAIAMSGHALLPWATTPIEKATNKSKALAASLNCPTENSTELVKCLRSLPLSDFLAACKQDAMDTRVYDPSKNGHVFTPIIEVIDDDEALLTQNPLDIIIEEKAPKMPMMFGVTKDEGLLFTYAFYRNNFGVLDFVEENWESCIGRNFEMWKVSRETELEMMKKTREFYFPSKEIHSWSNEEKVAKYTELLSDLHFFVGTSLAAKAHRKNSPVFLYYLERPFQLPFANMGAEMGSKLPMVVEFILYFSKAIFSEYIMGQPPRNYGVGHGQDAAFYFPLFSRFVTIPKDEKSLDYKFSKDLVKLFLTFATDETTMEFRKTKFNAVDSKGPLSYLRLDGEAEMTKEPFAKRAEFWFNLNYAQCFSSNTTKIIL